MTQIDTSKPVMVTGANGYVASWLVKKLLDQGRNVHAAVRNPDNENKIGHLKALAKDSKGDIKFFSGDLLQPGSYKEAMEGCELVYHTASPFTNDFKDPQKDLVDPAVLGTQNVLDAANQTPSVKRVVVTSSCAAIYTDASDCQKAPNGALTEDNWNDSASLDYQPYSLSKTLAEKKAWQMAKAQDRWDLVTINPSFVVGPSLNPTGGSSESVNLLTQMGDGSYKSGAPRLAVGVVDVRDVAEAHFLAGNTPEASGRYITSAHNTDFFEMTQVLSQNYGNKLPLPKSTVPKWLLMLIGPFVNKALSRRYVRNNVNVPWKADNSKIRKELGVEFRPLQQTMEDAMQNLIDAGVLKTKG